MLNFSSFRVIARHVRCFSTPSQIRLPPVIFENEELIVRSIPVTAIGMNQYLIGCKMQKRAALIDSGCDRPERWIEAAAENGMKITTLLQTHGHVDHVCGLKVTKDMLPHADIYAHPDDWYIYKSAPAQGLMFGLDCPMPPTPDKKLYDNDVIEVGKMKVSARHCPGHSPGHLAFLVETNDPKRPLLFCGDLIFQGSIGRTDFPGCNASDMQKSLAELRHLPRETLLFPGHMAVTTIGAELDSNPFLRGL